MQSTQQLTNAKSPQQATLHKHFPFRVQISKKAKMSKDLRKSKELAMFSYIEEFTAWINSI